MVWVQVFAAQLVGFEPQFSKEGFIFRQIFLKHWSIGLKSAKMKLKMGGFSPYFTIDGGTKVNYATRNGKLFENWTAERQLKFVHSLQAHRTVKL